jgi:hypothetical protein
MSVKQMTTTQIRDDLEAIALTWSGGIPPEQTDRVSALQRELKRRGEETVALDKVTAKPREIGKLGTADLEKELRALSDRIGRSSDDEAAQRRFADVRFELRRRARTESYDTDPNAPPRDETAKEYVTSRPPLPPRELELPDDDMVDANASARKALLEAAEIEAAALNERRVPRRDSKPAESVTVAPGAVRGYSASTSGDEVVVTHEWVGERGSSVDTNRLTIAETDAFIVLLQNARMTAATSKR